MSTKIVSLYSTRHYITIYIYVLLEVREEGVREGGGRVQQFGDGEVETELGWGGHHLPSPRLLDQVSLHLLQY